ncbi:MAG: cytochrome c family protein [Planctomycetes bacterium]|nr:cytochrome c family protein [Planctomycetota bacterium]
MPQVFHPSMNTLSRVSIFGALAFVAAVVWLGMQIAHSAYMTEVDVVHEQPVPFSHQHHVNDCGIDCRYCHGSVEKSSTAGLPATSVCMNCHAFLWNDSPMLRPVRESLENDVPLFWSRVHDLPDFAYFDHSIHVAKGIGCAECHGQVDRMPLMRREHSLYMQWCLDCHRRPQEHVRPRDEVFNLDWERPQRFDEEAALLVEAYGIETKTSCSICHR